MGHQRSPAPAKRRPGAPGSSGQVSVQKTEANLGTRHQAPGHATVTLHDVLLVSHVEAAGIMRA